MGSKTFNALNLDALKLNVVSGAATATSIAVTGIVTADHVMSVEVDPENYFALVDGADSATSIAVTGLLTTDELIQVLELETSTNNPADRTAEASISSAGNIQLSTTDTTSDKLAVLYKRPAADLTSEASIHSDGNLQLSTTITTGRTLRVRWYDVSAAEA